MDTAFSRRRFLAGSTAAAIAAAAWQDVGRAAEPGHTGSQSSGTAASQSSTQSALRAGKGTPNIVYILADDLGIGDVHCFNRDHCKIATPNLDRLASQGVRCTDAHADSALCTPSRYGLLTGRYSWRTWLQSGVLTGYEGPLIPPTRLTIAKLLQQHGYYTACVGKWHLGLHWPPADASKPTGMHGKEPTVGTKLDAAAQRQIDNVDYTQAIGGPRALGFDYFFGLPASMDMAPYVWIENEHAAAQPTEVGAHFRAGVQSAGFDPVDGVPLLVEKAVHQVREHCKPGGAPMFLYLPLTSPHGPHVPTAQFAGKSGLGKYADFVMETDWAVGEVIAAIDAAGVADNTLFCFASDNGCGPHAELKSLLAHGHFPSAQFRGYKCDIWDGGHRVPFIARWPGHIAAESTCDQLMCLNDFFATCAAVIGVTVPHNAGEDSIDMLPALLGQTTTPVRDELINHSGMGNFAIRSGKWKLELCPGSGGWGDPKNDKAIKEGLPPVQLYRMDSDEGERTNLQSSEPQRVKAMLARAEHIIQAGRSTPGPHATNDVKVDLWKGVPPLDISTMEKSGGD